MVEIEIGRQHGQAPTQTELGQECADGTQLDSATSALISKLGGLDVVGAIRDDHGESPESIDQRRRCLGSTHSLQQFLKDQIGRQDRLSPLQRLPEARRFFATVWAVPAKGQRPNTGIDEEAQSRERSVL